MDASPAQELSLRRHLLGVALILAVVTLWVGASFLMKSIFTTQHYAKPFFLTFVNTSTFTLYLLPTAVRGAWARASGRSSLGRRWGAATTQVAFDASSDGDDDDNVRPRSPETVSAASRTLSASRQVYAHEDVAVAAAAAGSSNAKASQSTDHFTDQLTDHVDLEPIAPMTLTTTPMSTLSTMALALQFCFLWFLANFSLNFGLTLTNVASATIMSSTSSFWTILVGSLAHVERFSFLRLMAVVVSITGVVLVSTADLNDDDSANDWRGDLMALASAIFYGLYITFIKVRVPASAAETLSTPLFFGFVGLFNIILLWPLFPILDALGLEPFVPPPDASVWRAVLTNALLGTCLSEMLWLQSMLLTSPLVATMGLSMTIPLALVGDVAWNGIRIGVQYWFGAFFVIATFLFINYISFHRELDDLVDKRVWNVVTWLRRGRGSYNQLPEPSMPHQDELNGGTTG